MSDSNPNADGFRQKELARREALLETKQCMGCMHEGMIVTSLDGTIIEATTTAEHILNTPSPTLTGHPFQDFCASPDVYNEIRQQAIRDGRLWNRSVLMSAGSEKPKLVNLSVQVSGTTEPQSLVHVFRDCADLLTLEERLLQSERLATVGRFASQIAHEIRNPLNSISLNVEMLEDEVASNEGARELIRSVLKELDRLNEIVSEYLQFSRFPKPHLKRAHAEAVIRELAESIRMPESVSLRLQLADPSPELWLDEGLIRQVLDNLVRNATESMDGSGSVEIATEVLDRHLVIRVKDTGAGISTESQARLFEPFFTTKPQGTGLGLATSQQIIFEHNGHISVESQPGRGSTFSILLPL